MIVALERMYASTVAPGTAVSTGMAKVTLRSSRVGHSFLSRRYRLLRGQGIVGFVAEMQMKVVVRKARLDRFSKSYRCKIVLKLHKRRAATIASYSRYTTSFNTRQPHGYRFQTVILSSGGYAGIPTTKEPAMDPSVVEP